MKITDSNKPGLNTNIEAQLSKLTTQIKDSFQRLSVPYTLQEITASYREILRNIDHYNEFRDSLDSEVIEPFSVSRFNEELSNLINRPLKRLPQNERTSFFTSALTINLIDYPNIQLSHYGELLMSMLNSLAEKERRTVSSVIQDIHQYSSHLPEHETIVNNLRNYLKSYEYREVSIDPPVPAEDAAATPHQMHQESVGSGSHGTNITINNVIHEKPAAATPQEQSSEQIPQRAKPYDHTQNLANAKKRIEDELYRNNIVNRITLNRFLKRSSILRLLFKLIVLVVAGFIIITEVVTPGDETALLVVISVILGLTLLLVIGFAISRSRRNRISTRLSRILLDTSISARGMHETIQETYGKKISRLLVS